MVFNRRRKSKVKWEKQVTKARRETKDQFDRLHDQPSAVSDLSETVFTNGSEVDAIGMFGKNNAYARGAGESFTLGMNTEEFEPIGDYDPAMYNIGQFADESTYDNTYGDSGYVSNQVYSNTMESEEGRFTNEIPTQDSGFTGEQWGQQDSYRVQGLESASDVVGQSQSQSQNHFQMRSRSQLSKNQARERHNAKAVFETDSNSDDLDESNESKASERSFSNYFDDYDVPEPARQSPIVVLYDTILSHPLLTCISFPCIPCLALYVKTSEKPAPSRSFKKIERKVKVSGKHRLKSTRSKDDSTFAEYHANQVSCRKFLFLLYFIMSIDSIQFNCCKKRRFDDISQEPEERGEIDSPRNEELRSKLRHRTDSMNSRNSEFSEIRSKGDGKFFLGRLGKGRRSGSRVETIDFSQIQSNGRPDSRGIYSAGEYSNIMSQQDRGVPSYDPDAAYDNLGNQYSLGLQPTTSGDNDAWNFVNNVPQGAWNYGSVDDRSSNRSNLSVGWKDTVMHHGQSTATGSFDRRDPNGAFWQKVSGTFSTHTGDRDTFDPTNDTSYSNQIGIWNQVGDSFSVKGFGSRVGQGQFSGNSRMARAMGTIDTSTYGSGVGDPYYRQ